MENKIASDELVKAVVATAQIMGTDLSHDAASMFCADLAEYPEQLVAKALTRCRREVRGRLTLSEVIARIDDGRPGPEEAWAMLPRSEAETVVWTEEMLKAWSVAEPLMDDDDTAARMAFREAYTRLLVEARAQRQPVQWLVSLGHDAAGREPVLRAAVDARRIGASTARALLPHGEFTDREIHAPALTHDGPIPVKNLLEREI